MSNPPSRLQAIMMEVAGHLDKRDLTGPHHVGAEIDLEYQAYHRARMETASRVLGGAAAALIGWGAFRGERLSLGAGFGAAVSAVLAERMSRMICSRSVTDGPRSLRVLIGDTGKWTAVTADGKKESEALAKGKTFMVARHSDEKWWTAP